MASKFDLGNWEKGKVSLFQAFGLKGATYPDFSPRLLSGTVINNPGPAGAGATSVVNGSGSPGQLGGGSLGGTSAANGCTAAQTSANQKLGQQLAQGYGWGSGQSWADFNWLIMSESGWCHTAQNPTSTAYGIGQFLNTTWATVGGSKTSDAKTQIALTLLYVKMRYGNPTAAKAFHLKNNWY